jgi:hypothetical protein
VRSAVDAQVDPVDTPTTRRRRLERIAAKIEYWQAARRRAARSHRKRTLRILRNLGIRLSDAIRCFGRT